VSDLDLTGRWTGVYFYPDDDIPPNGFTADLIERGGHISGRTSERSELRLGQTLGAEIEGQRNAVAVAFTKIPDDGSPIIEYAGELSPDGQSLSGTWTIIGDWSGTFRMDRRSDAATTARTRVAQAD
jgi:hypothetical protein